MAWDLIEKSGNPTGGGWDYNEPNLTYNEAIDPDTFLSVFYNSLGADAGTWTNTNKS